MKTEKLNQKDAKSAKPKFPMWGSQNIKRKNKQSWTLNFKITGKFFPQVDAKVNNKQGQVNNCLGG